jgi:nucleoid-associated protein YgaU
MKKRLLGIMSACLLAGMVQADSAPLTVKDSAPERYTVVAGDTLWGISGRYLNDPWRWPEIWEANKQVYNPHLIFPGDVLLLCKLNAQTILAVDQGGGCAEIVNRVLAKGDLPTTTELSDGTVKLHPKIREMPLSLAIPTIPLKDIQRYLNDSRVVTLDELNKAPYVVATENNRVIAGKGDRIFIRNKDKLLSNNKSYGIYRGGMAYIDPTTKKVLGYEAEDIGGGKTIALDGEVGTMLVSRSTQDIRIGDKLLENESGQISSSFQPSNPEGVNPGNVLRIFGSIASGAQYSVIVINRGEADGVRAGHAFALFRKGAVITDRISKETLTLPSENAGLAMVFRTFQNVSYALILRSTTTIKVGDEVRPPLNSD